MTTTAATITPAQTRADAPPAPVRRGYRFELVKLLAQWPVRIGLLACFVGPAIFVAIVSQQSSLPTDSVFGRWMGQTGWAGALVILMFACNWVLPLLTSLVSGDVFAAEDRLGTWRHLLVAVRSPQRIFASKALAALTVIVVLAFGLALSGIVGGLLSAGSHALVGLDGHLLEPGHAAIAVVLAWLAVFAPTLAFAGHGQLGAVARGRSPMGVVLPARRFPGCWSAAQGHRKTPACAVPDRRCSRRRAAADRAAAGGRPRPGSTRSASNRRCPPVTTCPAP